MNFKATASSIAASGGIRPDSHITARPVTARKAGPVAHTLVAATLSIVLGGTTVAIAGVIEGRLETSGRSDLSPSSTFPFLCRTTVYHRYYAERTARQGTSHRYAYALADCRGGKSLTGQRSRTDERLLDWESPVGATSRSGGVRICDRNLGNPCAEKAGACRSRSIFSL